GPGSDEYLMSLMEEHFRITPIRNHLNQLLTVAQNIEPSNIIVAPNGRVAYVALAKNNAIARINLDTNLVSTIYPLGNRSWSNYYMDASDRDNAISMRGYNIHTTYQARQLKWLTQGNSQWLLSLDSGFLNEVPEYSYRDWERGKTLLESGAIDTSDSVLRSQLNNDALLGRAAVSKDDGRGPDGTIENVFLFGGRGISIRDGDTMEVRTTLVDNIERMAAQYHEEVFNTRMESPSDTPQGNRDSTSPLLGPSLTFMETGIFQGNRVLFLGSAHSGIIYVYALSADANCPQPFFHSTHRRGSTFSSWDTLFAQGTIGDLGISDMLYLSDDDLTPVLAVASSLSNSLSIYSVVEAVIDITP
ncbi:hypothetical protein MP969_25660, partial [Escherichia coli]|nr:hypothetical protein [Escherichia coli]